MSNRIRRLLAEPLIQFLLIGACIYGAYALVATPEDNFRDARVHVDANRINGFISQWESRWKRPPTREELDGLIQAYIREDVLYRQAVAMGLNEDDPITRRRMAQKLEFLTSDLAGMMEPSDDELEVFFEENRTDYQQPERISIRQVYFNPERRPATTLEDAARALSELKSAGTPGPLSLEVGDASMMQSDFQMASQVEISRQLGKEFAESVMQLEVGRWHGPVLSGYGTHLVYVYGFHPAPATIFEDVKTLVADNYLREQRQDFNDEFLESLKKRYEIVIDEIPVDRLLSPTTGSAVNTASGQSSKT